MSMLQLLRTDPEFRRLGRRALMSVLVVALFLMCMLGTLLAVHVQDWDQATFWLLAAALSGREAERRVEDA